MAELTWDEAKEIAAEQARLAEEQRKAREAIVLQQRLAYE